MAASRCHWPPASGSAGCGWPTSAPGRPCGPRFSPQAAWPRVGAAATRDELRAAFGRWGRPGRVRVDNGAPWGATGGLPTPLALWLLGLGVGVTWNDPRRPQQNGVVERSQGVAKAWAEPHACATAAELAGRLGRMDEVQRSEYPAAGGVSRLAAHPGLAHSGRPYAAGAEASAWDLGPVLEHLAERVVERRVGADGKVSLYDRPRYVGRRAAGQRVYVTVDPESAEWVVADTTGRTLRRLRAEELSRERILALDVARERERP
jgi:hypothetical protein